jgi:photosystem II stability/assembly factor-like uncharacterized protein
MVTQEPHLCENCGHIDPLELPYCGFCGHPNETATDEQRAAAPTGMAAPSAGTAAAAADLADLIAGPGPEAGVPANGDEAAADADFEFNADTDPEESSVAVPAAAVVGADLAAAGDDVPVQWGSPGEWSEPPPATDPFAEDFTAVTTAGAPASDPIQQALLTGTVPAAAATALTAPPLTGAPTGAAVPPGGGDFGLSSSSSGPSGGRGGRSRTMLILVTLIIVAVIIAVIVAVSGGGSSNKSGSATTTTTSSATTATTGTGTRTTTGPSTHAVVIAGTASAPWTNVVYPPQYAAGHLFTLSCATPNACFGVGASQTGAEILSTLDGGTTWNNDTYPSSTNLQNNGHLFSIFCPTSSACETVGTASNGAGSQLVIMGTSDGGNTWVNQAYPSGLTNGHLFSVYCASASTCWALGGQSDGTPVILATTDGGSTWAQQTYPSGLNLAGSGFLSIACPTTKHCIISASGNGGLEILVTTDGGNNWATKPLPPGVVTKTNGIGSVSCGSDKFCTITGFSNGSAAGTPPIIISTNDGGNTWQVDPYPASLGLTTLTGVWCTGATDCWALGNNANGAVIVATHDTAKTWALQHYPLTLGKNDLVSLSCPTTSTCWIVGVGQSNTPVVLVARKS